jgi:LuxR family maltose regulon positive regulatory protein
MPQPALAALREAVELGYPLGYRRVFTEQGPLMGEMLHELAREPKFAAMAGSLLAELARVGKASQPWLRRQVDGAEWVIEPLTERELEILSLLAGGLSNKEIAYRLGISSITVRNHAANLYGKLHVEGRREAVSRARQLGLLPSS